MGGYFICNGIERIIRLLILQRRHYIMALRRSAYQKRGSNYTDSATLIRCVSFANKAACCIRPELAAAQAFMLGSGHLQACDCTLRCNLMRSHPPCWSFRMHC